MSRLPCMRSRGVNRTCLVTRTSRRRMRWSYIDPGVTSGTVAVAVHGVRPPHAPRSRPSEREISALLGAYGADMIAPDMSWQMPLTTKSYGSGSAPFSFNCVCPRNGVTTWQSGLPLTVVDVCGVVGDALEMPLTVVAVCGAVTDPAAMPGASTTKQLSVIVRPVSMPPPNDAPPRSRV